MSEDDDRCLACYKSLPDGEHDKYEPRVQGGAEPRRSSVGRHDAWLPAIGDGNEVRASTLPISHAAHPRTDQHAFASVSQ